MSKASSQAEFQVHEDQGRVSIAVSGDWQGSESASGHEQLLVLLNSKNTEEITLDFQDLKEWDSRVPATLYKILCWAEDRQIPCSYKALPEDIRPLLQILKETQRKPQAVDVEERDSFFERVGLSVLAYVHSFTDVCDFIGEQILEFFGILRGRSSIRYKELFVHVQECGPAALPIVTLISLLVGFILAFIAAVQLEKFGAEIYMANLVSLAMFREMGAVMASVILAGRTGAAFAANIGAMQVNQEVDALQAFGISPQGYLIVPRIIALLFMMPLLCIYADVLGVIGGGLVGVALFDFSMQQYIEQARLVTGVGDVFVGLIKATVFGLLIAFAGCYHGIHCARTASAVGTATTRAVVSSIVLIVLADAVFAVMFHLLGM